MFPVQKNHNSWWPESSLRYSALEICTGNVDYANERLLRTRLCSRKSGHEAEEWRDTLQGRRKWKPTLGGGEKSKLLHETGRCIHTTCCDHECARSSLSMPQEPAFDLEHNVAKMQSNFESVGCTRWPIKTVAIILL